VEYRKLGRSGLKVSPLCLGAMMFGGPTDELSSHQIMAHAKDAGVNFVDTADAYGDGASEEVIGRFIKGGRQHWVVATKLANQTGKGPNDGGLSRAHVFRAAEASLKRLSTDVIDVLYLHKEDHDTPLAETVHALADLVRQGKIRYFGLSNHRSWRLAEICNICDRLGIDRPVVSQPYYNAMNRMPEVEHLPACAHYGLGVFPYSPLARGVMTGKYAPNVKPAEGTRAARQDRRMMQTEWRHESLVIAQELKRHCEAKAISTTAFAVGWVMNNKLITGTIAGPRTMEQWTDYLTALDYRFTAEDEALVDKLVPAGHPSTPGYNDPAYPIEGRPLRGS
jgi:aryl-alcohol dehydrogenase (NADP+)